LVSTEGQSWWEDSEESEVGFCKRETTKEVEVVVVESEGPSETEVEDESAYGLM
jgi:hypothetical protein